MGLSMMKSLGCAKTMKLKPGNRIWYIVGGFVQIVLKVKIDILNFAVISLKIKDDFNIIEIKFWKGKREQ